MREKASNAGNALVGALYDLAGWTVNAVRKLASWIWLYLLAGIIIALTIVGLLEFAGINTGVSDSVVDPIIVMAIGCLAAVIPARLVVNYFTQWHSEDVYRVDALKGRLVRHFYVAPAAWDEKTVEDGEVYQDESGNYYVRSFEQTSDGLVVTGPHRGKMNDVELETWEQAVKANRGTLRKWANIGQNLYAAIPSIAQSIESAYWERMSNDTLDNTAMHPDVARSQVVENVEEMVDSVELPDEPDAEEMMREAADDVTDGAIEEVEQQPPDSVGKDQAGGDER